MVVIDGKSVFGGIAIGHIAVFQKGESLVKRRSITDTGHEVKRFTDAKEEAKKQLQGLYQKALQEVGEASAMIFDVHQMLDDLDYTESITNMIETQKINAEFAVASTGDNFCQMFAAMDDDYMKERVADIKDISNRVIMILQGRNNDGLHSEEPVILLAEDLAPSETVQLDKSKVLSFVTRHGSTNSHTTILARTMNIPALIDVDIQPEWNGKLAIVDGKEGQLIIEPDEETLAFYRRQQQEEQEARALLSELKGQEDITLDGKRIKLYANIAGVGDVANVLANDAAGIGLFRSEFLYLEAEDYPDEETQFLAYKRVAEMMAGKKVVVRTLDIGADKQVDYFKLDKEDNPAMGFRAIRICLERPEIFRTQLRALIRASAYGEIAIMYPMIISVEEVCRIREIVDSVKSELDEQGISYGNFEQGIMIETPAAVMMSEELAQHVDFFSIGTNDLTQYTLAIDRQNMKLDSFYDPHHPAILKMIQTTITNGHKGGCWVGICGELGADTSLTETFLKMGVDELSVSPSFVLPVRRIIRSTNILDDK